MADRVLNIDRVTISKLLPYRPPWTRTAAFLCQHHGGAYLRHAMPTQPSSLRPHVRPPIASGGPRWSRRMYWLRRRSIRPWTSYFRNGWLKPHGHGRRARDGHHVHLCRHASHRDGGRSARILCGSHASITAEQYEPTRSSVPYTVT